jgi:hypothetical protein
MATEHEAIAHEIRMFTPNVLLPAQVLRPPAISWLRRLYVAILSDALDCLEGKGPPSKMSSARDITRGQHEAWEWMMSEAEHCFAFLTICAVLDLNVEAIRREVRQRFVPGRVSQPGFPRSLRQLHAGTSEPSPRTEQRPEPESYGARWESKVPSR